MNKILCLLLLSLLFIPVAAAQPAGSVSFFCEPDTAFRQVHVGAEVQVCYLSNRNITKHTPPVWNVEEVERISGPSTMSSSRMETINGVSEMVSLKGIYYAVRFLKPGTFTLPVITAVIEGNTYTCAPVAIRVLPAEFPEEIVCTLTTEPASPKAGEEFRLVLTTNCKPDPSTPAFLHEGVEQLSFSGTSTSKNGVESYRYIYTMKAKRPGSYVIVPLNLTFGGTEYPLKAYQLDIEGSNYLWVIVCFAFYVGALLYYLLQFRKEGKQLLADFVKRTGRLNLSIDNAMTHYRLPIYFFGISAFLSGFTTYDCLQGIDTFHKPLLLFALISIPTLLGILVSYWQYRKLFFVKIVTRLTVDELYEVIQQVGVREEWLCEFAGEDCVVIHTPGGFSKMSWGEQVFIVFDTGQVWINSICDLQKRASITSFGQTKKNIRMLQEAIT